MDKRCLMLFMQKYDTHEGERESVCVCVCVCVCLCVCQRGMGGVRITVSKMCSRGH